MNEEWVLSIREQCEAANVAFFFKQWGGTQKKAAGRELAGRTFDEVPPRTMNAPLPAANRLRHALAIEDSRNGMLAAKRAGMRCLVVPNGMTHAMNFAEADWVVKSLQDFRVSHASSR